MNFWTLGGISIALLSLGNVSILNKKIKQLEYKLNKLEKLIEKSN